MNENEKWKSAKLVIDHVANPDADPEHYVQRLHVIYYFLAAHAGVLCGIVHLEAATYCTVPY
jgi:hypothetical protein